MFNLTNFNILLFKLKVYSLAVEKRGLIACDDKRLLLANLDNGKPNPNTNVYGHYSLANKVRVQDADEQAAAGNNFQIVSCEKKEEARLQRKHTLAIKRARRTQPEDISDDDEAEVHGDDLILVYILFAHLIYVYKSSFNVVSFVYLLGVFLFCHV